MKPIVIQRATRSFLSYVEVGDVTANDSAVVRAKR